MAAQVKSRHAAMQKAEKKMSRCSSNGSGGMPSPVTRDRTERDPSIFYAGRHRRKYNQAQVIDALIAADGALTHAARRLGTSYRHLKKYIDANDKLTEVLHGIEETNLDAAESTLFAAIREGNLTATIFYLKTRGKGRGYAEHEKQDMSNLMQPVTIVYHSPRSICSTS
jgi:hypothetical protein